MKSTSVSARCSVEVKRDIEESARKEGRNVSNFLLWLYNQFKRKDV